MMWVALRLFAAMTVQRSNDCSVRVFLNHECPCNLICAPDLNELGRELNEAGVSFAGVIDLAQSSLSQYQAQTDLTIPLIPDPGLKQIKLAKAAYSLEIRVFSAKGKCLKKYMGYSQTVIRNMAELLTAASHREIKLDAAMFPSTTRIGCAFSATVEKKKR